MIDTRLVLFDGIAGSGKTTISQWLHVRLTKAGQPNLWITESQQNHPVYQKDIAAARTADEAIERAVDSWRRFADAGAEAPSVSVMDGSILDSPISFLLLQDTPAEQIARAVCRMSNEARRLRPALCHLYQDDVNEAIDTICRRRGDAWRQHLIAYVSSSPFARNRNCTGIEAPQQYYREHRRIADMVFAELDMPKLAISTSGARWQDYRARILEFLGVTGDAAEQTPAHGEGLTGEYRDVQHDLAWRIGVEHGELYLERDTRLRLIHIDGRRYFIEGVPVELTFEGPDDGPATRIQYRSSASDGLESELTWVRV